MFCVLQNAPRLKVLEMVISVLVSEGVNLRLRREQSSAVALGFGCLKRAWSEKMKSEV